MRVSKCYHFEDVRALSNTSCTITILFYISYSCVYQSATILKMCVPWATQAALLQYSFTFHTHACIKVLPFWRCACLEQHKLHYYNTLLHFILMRVSKCYHFEDVCALSNTSCTITILFYISYSCVYQSATILKMCVPWATQAALLQYSFTFHTHACIKVLPFWRCVCLEQHKLHYYNTLLHFILMRVSKCYHFEDVRALSNTSCTITILFYISYSCVYQSATILKMCVPWVTQAALLQYSFTFHTHACIKVLPFWRCACLE